MTARAAAATVYLAGSTDEGEFVAATEWLDHRYIVRRCASFADATALLSQHSDWPELAVALQSWPEQFPLVETAAFQAQAPLVAVLCVYGAWCEGELRSGRPWPASLRVSATGAVAVLERGWAARAAGRPAPWDLPRTSAPDDRVLAADEALVLPRGAADDARLAFVVARDSSLRGWLLEACRRAGWHAVGAAAVESLEGAPQVLVGDIATPGDLEPLARAWRTSGAVHCVALDHFVRHETRRHAAELGIVLVEKPCTWADLLAALERKTASRAATVRAAPHFAVRPGRETLPPSLQEAPAPPPEPAPRRPS